MKKANTLIREVHFYVSMIACCIILFFAVTGFFANHKDWLDNESKEGFLQSVSIPKKTPVNDKANIETFFKSLHSQNAVVEIIVDDGDFFRLVASSNDKRIRYDVDITEQTYFSYPQYVLPKKTISDDEIIKYCTHNYGGSFSEESKQELDEDDRGFSGFSFSSKSVWGDIDFFVDMENKIYEKEAQSISLTKSFIDIHKGKYNNSLHLLLMDMCAFFLCISAITGVIIGMQSKKYRKKTIIFSFVAIGLFLLLILGR